MRLVSWNVNGLRSCLGKGFCAALETLRADIVCLQETKLGRDGADGLQLPEYPCRLFHSAQKPGYAGTALFSRLQPLRVSFDFEGNSLAGEGRVITAEFDHFQVVNAYVPNSQNELRRLDYRINQWEPALRRHLTELSKRKPVIYTGDLNVSHREIDLARPAANRRNAGFTDEERAAFDALLEAGFIDTYRHFYPDRAGAYSWWSYRGGARERNVGWRLDYFLASRELQGQLQSADIHAEITGSDHCPVSLDLSTP